MDELTPTSLNWIEAAALCNKANQSFVLLTVLKTQGSTPRDAEAKMVVTSTSSMDTIGGGKLEFEAIETAQQLLVKQQRCTISQTYDLAQDLEQCCGGSVTLLFECFPSQPFELVLFGAGHIGTALVQIICHLPWRVRWIDSRPDCFAQKVASNIQTLTMQSSELTVENCAPNSLYLVMTHSHTIDQQLIEAILSRGDSQFCGLIGSKSKAASFRSRLKRKGFSNKEIAQLSSPIGLNKIKSKVPMEIAVSVVAQLLQLTARLNCNDDS